VSCPGGAENRRAGGDVSGDTISIAAFTLRFWRWIRRMPFSTTNMILRKTIPLAGCAGVQGTGADQPEASGKENAAILPAGFCDGEFVLEEITRDEPALFAGHPGGGISIRRCMSWVCASAACMWLRDIAQRNVLHHAGCRTLKSSFAHCRTWCSRGRAT